LCGKNPYPDSAFCNTSVRTAQIAAVSITT
jgi:hypothetical protein